MSNKSLVGAAPLFLVLLIDSMGLGLLFPVLSSMIIDSSSQFLAHDTSMFQREFLYGLVIGIYMLCWFFGAAILGDLSDIIGRKKALVICLLGAFVGYAISGVAVFYHSILFLIVGRVIAGFTAGSQPIAQAAIVDISTEEHKARNIGYILFAVSIGFVLGPLLGGVLSDPKFVSWFNFTTPLYFSAVASLLNVLFLVFCFHETHEITRKVKIRLHYAVQIFIEAFQSKKIRWLALVLFVYIAGWGEYFGFIAQFLLRRYHYTPFDVSMFLVVMGIGFTLGFGVLVDPLSRIIKLKTGVLWGFLVAAILCLVTYVTHTPWIAWVCTVIIGMGIAVAYSMIITLCSNQVDASEQGWIMGVTNSVFALSFGVTTFFSGFAANYGAGIPILLAAIGLFISFILMLFYRA